MLLISMALKAIGKGAERYGGGTRSTSSSDPENSSAINKKTGEIASKEPARDVYTRASLTNPRFKPLPESGEIFPIVGAQAPPCRIHVPAGRGRLMRFIVAFY